MSQIKPIQRVLLAVAVVLSVAVVAPLDAAQPPAPVTVTSPSHAPLKLTAGDLARLPMVKVDVAFLTEHGERRASFEGPLLWTVLEKAGAVEARPRQQASQTVVVVGRDGYRAVLALAEIAPEFEGKQVILADRMNGQPLGEGHLRVVVPLDRRGGRSVRDVARIEVRAPPP
jgi:DMSO/TMAO reductase YedYZ molybdopterin-dependent catalytic subunit